MKILQLVHAFPPFSTAGVEVYAYNLCKQLSEKHQVYIFHRVSRTEEKEYKLDSLQNGRLTTYTINNTFKYCYSFQDLYINDIIANEFERILEAINPDIIHIQHLLFLSASLVKKIKLKRIPVVFTLHDYWLICPQWHYLKNNLELCEGDNKTYCAQCLADWLYIKKNPKKIYYVLKRILPNKLIKILQRIYLLYVKGISSSTDIDALLLERRRYMEKLCDDIDLFISPSEFIRNKFQGFGVPLNKNILVRHGIDKALTKGHTREGPDKLTFGFIGTILPAKGLHILINAFNKIKNENVHLKVYGKLFSYKGFEYYPQYMRKLVENKNIVFMGNFDNKDIGRVMSEIDILITPSIWLENSPLTIQEAFCAKVPVIASRIGGIPELLSDGVNGLLFNPGDVNDLCEKIEYIINNPEIINKFKENMPKIKSIEENAEEMEQIYRGLISKHRL